MLPKLVTRNVTNAEVGGIVFGNEIIPKNSINKADEKKPSKSNYSHLAERGKGVSNLTIGIIRKLIVKRERSSGKLLGGTVFTSEITPKKPASTFCSHN
jgi:hypothetical protein